MAFTGDLEHLPIVDVVQLMHSTRKSGILRVRSRKGESQLVFKDGYIVSANHLNNSIRIGQVLLDLKVISPEALEKALNEQKEAGGERKPLVVSLVEKGVVKETDAYKGLEQLIEMTIVEILTWKKGTFELEMGTSAVSDEYRYYPDKMSREINVDTQSVLMESLRIFDEKIRDGEITEESGEEEGADIAIDDSVLSEDLLGLADLDALEKNPPKVFSSVTIFDPTVMHRTRLKETLQGLSPAEEDALAAFLGKHAAGDSGDCHSPRNATATVILLTEDEFFSYGITSVCEQSGIHVHTCCNRASFNEHLSYIRPSISTFLIIDAADKASRESLEERLALITAARQRYPDLFIIQLTAPGDYAPTLEAYRGGIRAVLPRPIPAAVNSDFVHDAISFLSALPAYIEQQIDRERSVLSTLASGFSLLGSVRETSELALSLLQLVAEQFDRSLTLIVRDSELVAEKGIGIKGEKSMGASPAMGFRIPLKENSILKNVLEKGNLYYGECRDAVVRDHLHAVIGKPASPGCLLLPLKNRGKTISLTYGDFGSGESRGVNSQMLELLAAHADLILENLLFRKKAAVPAATK